MDDLKNRERYSTTVKNGVKKRLESLKNITGIPKTKLLDEAIDDLFEKYRRLGYRTKEEKSND